MEKTSKLSKKDLLFIGLMLFSSFFGAGNLIFPPFLGQLAGTSVWVSIASFCITAVGFPVLGVVAVAKSNGLENLAKRVNPIFASVFTVLIYLSIGPGLGIPRAGSLPFEMVLAPYLPESISVVGARFTFTLLFFAVAFWLSLTPSKLVDRMGKILTPVLLLLIAIMFVGCLVKPLGTYGAPTGEYATTPFIKGFLEGYLTMDTIAALNFGIVIALAVKSKGVSDEKEVVSSTIKAGVIAGVCLMAIYAILAHLGATASDKFGTTENGAQTLTNAVTYIFGKPGAVLLALIFTLACLTTCVGLISSCSQYFSTLTKKVSYLWWVSILTFSSMVLANMGLTKILSVSVPLLNAIYPMAIMLIVLGIFNKFFKGNSITYSLTMLFTGLVSVINALEQCGINFGFVSAFCEKLPLYAEGLGWVVPALLACILGVLLTKIKETSVNITQKQKA